MRFSWIACVCATGFVVLGPCLAARVLMLPFQMGSHINYFAAVADGLREYGHQAYMVVGKTFPISESVIRDAGINILTYETPENWASVVDAAHAKFCQLSIEDPGDLIRSIGAWKDWLSADTDYLHSDKTLMEKLVTSKFDLAILDGVFLHRHSYLIAESLKIPFVSFVCFLEPWTMKTPVLTSFVPYIFTEFTEKMTFFERLKNTFSLISFANMKASDSFVTTKTRNKYRDILHNVSVDDIALKSLLWLVVSDTVLDYPLPLIPHIIQIGGVTIQPPKPLSEELSVFFSRAKEGVIVVSFGSSVILPDKIIQALLKSFQSLSQFILWKLDPAGNLTLPKNVKTLKWLPQRDVLAHPNTKLFITHCGKNGQYEALYNGVPMVGMAVFADQFYNCRRMVYKGLGLSLVTGKVTSEKITHAVESVLHNKTFYANAGKAAEVLHYLNPNPRKRAASWVDHVIKYGGSHLRSHAVDMPWYQYLMLDMFLLFLLSFCIIVYISVTLIRTIGSRILLHVFQIWLHFCK